MDEQRLQEALNNCIDWLADGRTVADCLAAYPDLTAELRPLLQLGQSTGRARAPRAEVDTMRSRLDFQMHSLIADTDFKTTRFRVPEGAVVLLVASFALLIAGFFVLVPRDSQVAADPTSTATATPLPESTESVTVTATVTVSDTPEPTLTPSPTLTSTATVTDTATATDTPTLTDTASPTLTATTTATAVATVCTPSPPEDWVQYQVQSGDTLSEIAVSTGSTVAQLSAVNCLEGNIIIVGQWLHVPYLWQGGVDSGTTVGGTDDPDDSDDDPDDSDDDNSGSGSDNSGSGSDNSGSGSDNSGSGSDNSGSDDDDSDDPDDPDDDHS